MAKVKLSGLLGDIRGKVGGSVFVKSAGGLILRNRSTPVNRATVAQSISRNILFTLQGNWQRLTQSQRDCWALWTKLNPIAQTRDQDLVINAQQTFIKLNSYRLQFALTDIKDPIFATALIPPISTTLGLSAGKLIVTINRTINETAEFIILFLSFPVTITRNTAGTIFKAIIFNQSPGAASYDITDEYESVFGIVPVAGQNIFIKSTNADKISGKVLPFDQKRVTL